MNCVPKPIIRKQSCVWYKTFAYTDCRIILALPPKKDPCNPSPCGPNALCDNGVCSCLPEYQGDPYSGCRPECVLSIDCSQDKACIRNKCLDPCPGTCGESAQCITVNHIPSCSCPEGFTGDPFIVCRKIESKILKLVWANVLNALLQFVYQQIRATPLLAVQIVFVVS